MNILPSFVRSLLPSGAAERNLPAESVAPVVALEPAPAPEPVVTQEGRRQRSLRSMAAALPGIATSDMLRMTGSADQTLRACLSKVRSQSRALALNGDYAKAYLRMCEDNIIGPEGFKFQNKARDAKSNGDPSGPLDVVANRIVEQAFETWCSPKNCDVRGRLSWRAYQRHVVRTMVRDGEAFVRLVGGFKGSKHNFALQTIPAELVDETYWDDRLNIKCGIRFDDYGRAISYFVRQDVGAETKVPKFLGSNGRFYAEVPADEMLHIFVTEFPEQSRGFPWMHTSMIRLHQLGAYEEAEVMAARIGASKMGFISAPDGDGSALADGEDDFGRLSQTVSPGAIDVLPSGYSFQGFDPTHPSGNYGSFVKGQLRGVSSGFGVSYNGLANDLEGVNLSSLRSGKQDEREHWKCVQRDIRDQFLDAVFAAWIEFADLSGALRPLPSSKLDKFAAPVWQARGWSWIDPQAEIDAAVAAISNGLRTRTQVLAEQGLDLEDVLRQLREEQDLIKEIGVDIVSTAKAPQAVVAKEPKTPEKKPEDAAA